MKNLKIRKWLVGLAVTAAAVVVAAITVGRARVVENVRRHSAWLFEYEYIPSQNVVVDSCDAARASDSLYSDFRKKYRFHYQTLGLASFPDSSRMILVSELPPHFETDSLASIFARFAYKSEMRRHRIGYDGYVTDLVVWLGNATQENCDNLMKKLNKEMFLSEYKPIVAKLPIEDKRRYYAKENIDYQITLDEFNSWFLEGDGVEGDGNGDDGLGDVELFFRSGSANEFFSVSTILSSKARGVFFSQKPGFVAWAVAKHADIAAQKDEIRQFALDADLVLGALADSGTLVIIGRERTSPLCELPPLQVESILLLASITDKELSQSLDVNDLMAGKMNNGHDWCPTYLSRELENTEFGDLMTITDVLLKDWSERGTIQESNYRYPEPGYYPFDKPLFRKLGLNELVYNWNTAGAMYAIDLKGEDNTSGSGRDDVTTIYTLGRTGSLPVSYFNSQERSESVGFRYESQAYHYFATLGNTDLARVVQYTALYQLFIDNDISYSGNTYPSFPSNKPFLLYKPVTDLLNAIVGLDGNELTLLADSLSQRSFRTFQKEHVDKQLHENEKNFNMAYTDEKIEDIYSEVRRNMQSNIIARVKDVKAMLSGLSEEQSIALARFLSYPRGVRLRDREGYNLFQRARKVNQLMREMGKNNLDLLGMDLNDVKNYYASHLSGNAGRYTKTSSLVVTFNDLLTTGGHNLSSHISRVNTMSHYKRGKGNYMPRDYELSHEPETKEVGGRPTKPSAKGCTPTKSAAGGQTKSTKPAARQRGASRTGGGARPRGTVISSAPRATRGL